VTDPAAETKSNRNTHHDRALRYGILGSRTENVSDTRDTGVLDIGMHMTHPDAALQLMWSSYCAHHSCAPNAKLLAVYVYTHGKSLRARS
jgi:hypothetical protein